MVNSTQKYLIVSLFMLGIFIVHLQVLHNGFINYDDQTYITGNQVVQQGLTLEGIRLAFTTAQAYNWHPVTWLSHMLDIQLFGMNPMGHHLMNLLLHVANCLVLFIMLGRMTGTFWRSLCVAALFAVHPQHVESVAWIAERKDLLSTLFGFLTILAYLAYAKNGTIRHYLGVVVLLAAGLMAKPMLVTLPFVLLLLDYWPLGRLSIGRFHVKGCIEGIAQKPISHLIREKLPLLLLVGASSAVTYLVQHKEGAVNLSTPASLNFGNAFISYVKYIGTLFWPHPLAVIYPFNPDHINTTTVLGAVLFLVIASALLLREATHRPYLTVGWLWFIGTLVPVIGFVRVGDHSIADRYTYLPSVGLFIMVVWGAHELREKWRINKTVTALAALAVIGTLSVMTVQQEKYWANSITLFEHAVAVTNENSPAHKMLGLAYGAVGNIEKATYEGKMSRMLFYRSATKVNPADYAAHYMLANAYSELGQFTDAIKEYETSIRLNDKNSQAYNNLGIAYYSIGDKDAARKSFGMAVTLNPGNREAESNLATVELQTSKK